MSVIECWSVSGSKGALPSHYALEISKQMNSKDSETVVAAVRLLSANLDSDSALQTKVANLLYSEDINVSSTAMTALSSLRQPTPEVVAIVAKGSDSNDMSVQRRTAYTFRNMKIQDPELKRRALQIDPSMHPW